MKRDVFTLIMHLKKFCDMIVDFAKILVSYTEKCFSPIYDLRHVNATRRSTNMAAVK